jgi:pyruvate/2-oxoglutarate dehydrogenase complex dihydrolipoamide acyltransferase (E2) component
VLVGYPEDRPLDGTHLSSHEVKVPDIGDFKEVEVIEVLVKPGDAVTKEQSLVTLESDKATMEIPSPDAGVVAELRIKVGDKVSKGSPILVLESSSKETQKAEAPKAAPPTPSTGADIECDVVVIGAGPGGYFGGVPRGRPRHETVLVERYPALGGVCLNVGCIPSKALLHTAAIMDGARALASHGISFGEPKVDLAKLREFKNKVVGKLTGGLASMAKMRKVTVLQGTAAFLDKNRLQVDGKSVRFNYAIIAAGSQAAKLPFLPDDARIVDFDRRARAAQPAEEAAGDRRRHHRPRDGHGVLDARRAPRRGGDDGWPDARRRSRPGERVAEIQRAALRQGDAQDQDHEGRGGQGRVAGVVRGRRGQDLRHDSRVGRRIPNGKKVGAEKAGVNVDAKGFITRRQSNAY